MELVEPSLDDTEYFHRSTVDAFESAVHSLIDRQNSVLLWREYLLHLRLRATQSYENLSSYFSCTKRCLQAVDYRLVHDHLVSGKSKYYNDYSFHNEVHLNAVL